MYPPVWRCLLLGLLLGTALRTGAAEPYVETAKSHSWFSFSRPHADTPAEQLAFADRLRADQSLRRAGRHYRALEVTWPGSAEAPVAQLRYAETLEARGKMEDAFDQYQVLMDKYAGRFPYDQVLDRQFEIAVAHGQRRRLAWFGLPGLTAPERAVPMLEKIVQNGPQWKRAPEAQLMIGRAYEQSKQEDLAVTAYLLCEERFPDTEVARQASLGRARCWYRLSAESPNDEATLEEAYAAATGFLRRYPDAAEAADVKTLQADLLRLRAEKAFQRAVFYDRVARKPEAARASYETFVRSFPNSEHVEAARTRLREIEPSKEPAHVPSA